MGGPEIRKATSLSTNDSGRMAKRVHAQMKPEIER